MQNPWTNWDPDGLRTINDYRKIYQRGQKHIDKANAAWREGKVPSNMKEYEKAMSDQQWAVHAIGQIVKTARSIQERTGNEMTSTDVELLNDEDAHYKNFNSSVRNLDMNPSKDIGISIAKGNYGDAALYGTRDVALSLLMAKGFQIAGKALGVGAAVADDAAKFTAQGFTRSQAGYLAEAYEGMGHHFIPRNGTLSKWGLPQSIIENPLNILKPAGMSRGTFYELHFKVDPSFFGTKLPGGGSWSGSQLGLEKATGMGRLWNAAPYPLKEAVGSGAAGAFTGTSMFDSSP